MSKINVNTWEPEGSSTDAVMMASGDTVTVPSGATLTIASGATLTNSGTATGFPSNTPRFFAYNSTTDNDISDATYTTVVFDTESIDSDTAFTSNTFTVPAGEGGTYYISASAALGASAYGKYDNGVIRLIKTPDGESAATIAASSISAKALTYGAGWTADTYGFWMESSVQMVVTLTALDAIHVEVYSDNYTGTSRYFGGSDVLTRFMGFKLL
jgi:hypothetical protein